MTPIKTRINPPDDSAVISTKASVKEKKGNTYCEIITKLYTLTKYGSKYN